ncbi:MAG: SRPBCC family protein [Chloracidobacterium sp.]|uniref:SRPBCC family protein n=1 Tax=Chloracidobacterium validum TaxID=2821543 RepID=A0ABX8B5C5_9BACT|nr:SRPBCC family protein [Chloracidobacterium validum]QUW02168.1 SRPBCC family protein [Chloracidobacterium validum]
MNIVDVLEGRITIQAPPKAILPYLVEPALLPLWSPTEARVSRVGRKKHGVGAKLRVQFVAHGLDPIEYEIIHQEGTRLVSRFTGTMSGEDIWTLDPKDKRTEVHNQMVFYQPDFLTLVGWKAVGRMVAERDVRNKMPLLKRAVEEQWQPEDDS